MTAAAMRAKGEISFDRQVGLGEMSDGAGAATDSNAAKSTSARSGLGNMSHSDIKELWLQEEARERKLEVSRVNGKLDLADLTKLLSLTGVWDRLSGMHIRLDR